MYVLKPKKKGTQPCLALSALIVTNRWETIFFTGIRNKGTGSLPWHHPGSKLGFSILLGYDLCSWPFT